MRSKCAIWRRVDHFAPWNAHNFTSNVCTFTGNVCTFTGNVHTLTSNAHNCTSNVHTLTSNAHTLTSNAHSFTSNAHSFTSNVNTLTSNVNTLTSNVHTYASNAHTYTSNAHNSTREFSSGTPPPAQKLGREIEVRDSGIYEHRKGICSVLTMNKPATLNALDPVISRKILRLLADKDVRVVVLRASDDSKFFSSGGNLKNGVLKILSGPNVKEEHLKLSLSYLTDIYLASHEVGATNKVFVSVYNGTCVGGGCGLPAHGSIRISTEKTRIYFPETLIGFHLDAGMSFFLPRLDGGLGEYIGLLGAQLNGKEAYLAGISTHYVHSSKIPNVIADISNSNGDLASVFGIIENYNEEIAEEDYNWRLGGSIFKAISNCFENKRDLSDVVSCLRREADNECQEVASFARETLAALRKRSPLSLEICISSLNNGKRSDFTSAFKTEQNLTSAFLSQKILRERLLAALKFVFLEKNKDALEKYWASWNVPAIDLISETMVPICFQSNNTFWDYPHKLITGKPSLSEIKALHNKALSENIPEKNIVDYIAQKWTTQNSYSSSPDHPIHPKAKDLRFFSMNTLSKIKWALKMV